MVNAGTALEVVTVATNDYLKGGLVTATQLFLLNGAPFLHLRML